MTYGTKIISSSAKFDKKSPHPGICLFLLGKSSNVEIQNLSKKQAFLALI